MFLSLHIDIQVRLSDLANSEADALTNPKGERIDGEVIYYLVRFATGLIFHWSDQQQRPHRRPQRDGRRRQRWHSQRVGGRNIYISFPELIICLLTNLHWLSKNN